MCIFTPAGVMVGELTFWTQIHDYVMRKLSPSNTSGP